MLLSLVDALTSATDTPLGLAAAIVVPVVGAGIWSIKLVVAKLLERADKDRDFMLQQIESERASLKQTLTTLQSFVTTVSEESHRKNEVLERIAKEQLEIRADIKGACRAR